MCQTLPFETIKLKVQEEKEAQPMTAKEQRAKAKEQRE